MPTEDELWLLKQEARDRADNPEREAWTPWVVELIESNRALFEHFVDEAKAGRAISRDTEATNLGQSKGESTAQVETMEPTEREAREYLKGYTGSFEFLADMKQKFVVEHPRWRMSEKQVAAVLKCKAREVSSKPGSRPQRSSTGPEVNQDGIYRTEDGTVYKVQKAVHGSGRLYAKRLDPRIPRFEYDSGAIFKLKPEMKLTLEQAKEFGRLYGVCCSCGATLTDENSIAEGIGPICAQKEWFA